MSAQDQMRSMLDELMGTRRDGDNAGRTAVRFDDPKVCKSFLLGSCPHDTLQGTRMDIGECSRHHDLALRADYEMAKKNKEYYYEVDAMDHLEEFIKDCDKRTEQAKQRLKETQEELSAEAAGKLDKVHEIAEQIGQTLANAEELGAEGNVEESLLMMEKVEELKNTKMDAEMDYRQSMPASNYQQQKLRVCEVCSAYLGIHDNDRRLADHFGGKLHLGFIRIRERLEELKVTVGERSSYRGGGGDRSYRGGGGGGDYYRERDRDRDREHYRSRRPGGGAGGSSRSRSRSRDRGDRGGRRERSRSHENGGGGGGGGGYRGSGSRRSR